MKSHICEHGDGMLIYPLNMARIDCNDVSARYCTNALHCTTQHTIVHGTLHGSMAH